jgi:hypothetical protein
MSEPTSEPARFPEGGVRSFQSTESPTEPLDYKPLSMLALAGFVLAGAYALLVIVGAIGSFLTGTPFLLGTWSFAIPIIAAILCFLGWRQVQASESTRAGGKLAYWGGALSVLFGLGYLAYVSATYLAIRNQAADFALKWLREIKDNDINQAFYDSLEPGSRAGMDPKNRENFEGRFGPQEREGSGRLTAFGKSDTIRLLQQAGKDAKLEFLSEREWTYVRGGYQFRFVFQLSSPEGEFELYVTVHGSESKHKEFSGRQWYVNAQESGVNRPATHFSELGQQRLILRGDGQKFAREWQSKLSDERRTLEAVLDCVEPVGRAAKLNELSRRYAQATAAFLAGYPLAATISLDVSQMPADLRAEYERFVGGKLVDTESQAFWAPANQRATILEGVYGLFKTPALLARALQPLEGGIVLLNNEGSRIRMALDFNIRLPSRHLVETRLIVETDETVHPRTWRIVRFELERGRSRMPDQPGAPPGLQ